MHAPRGSFNGNKEEVSAGSARGADECLLTMVLAASVLPMLQPVSLGAHTDTQPMAHSCALPQPQSLPTNGSHSGMCQRFKNHMHAQPHLQTLDAGRQDATDHTCDGCDHQPPCHQQAAPQCVDQRLQCTCMRQLINERERQSRRKRCTVGERVVQLCMMHASGCKSRG